MCICFHRRCPKCQKLRKASKVLTLSRLPDVLLIHLKRFSFDGPFRNKLETNVDFPTKYFTLKEENKKGTDIVTVHLSLLEILT